MEEPLTRESFEQRYPRTQCERLVACRVYPDMEACLAVVDENAQVRADADVGLLQFDPAEAQRCLDAVAALECRGGLIVDVYLECREVYRGTLQVGDSCRVDSNQCGAGASCDFCGEAPCDIDCFGACCEGVCVPDAEPEPPLRVPEGGSCLRERCAEGLACDYDSQRCYAPAELGAPCDRDKSDSCRNPMLNECDYDTLVCVPRPGPNEACDQWVQCSGFTSCIEGRCAFDGAAGESCDPNAPPACLPNYGCSAQGCVPLDKRELCE